jgi:hypothetical protein
LSFRGNFPVELKEKANNSRAETLSHCVESCTKSSSDGKVQAIHAEVQRVESDALLREMQSVRAAASSSSSSSLSLGWRAAAAAAFLYPHRPHQHRG